MPALSAEAVGNDAIERLALPEHRTAIEALPGRVREEQRARATELAERLRARLGRWR